MKILTASTEGQEENIHNLIRYFYIRIFPNFFSEDEIVQFKQMKVLHISNQNQEYIGTLKESFTVMSCLATLISIIESHDKEEQEKHYKHLFSHNVSLLETKDLFFPFTYQQFSQAKMQDFSITIYDKPANQFLA
ncbi:DUF5365 family protein [Bacillus sp. 2205SS5-2]|uniref:DUF5365 family protein n=1 Tax=Bacillus sp. 2205SS5-2 TaxID=3109031 RepID=UPI0030079D49